MKRVHIEVRAVPIHDDSGHYYTARVVSERYGQTNSLVAFTRADAVARAVREFRAAIIRVQRRWSPVSMERARSLLRHWDAAGGPGVTLAPPTLTRAEDSYVFWVCGVMHTAGRWSQALDAIAKGEAPTPTF